MSVSNVTVSMTTTGYVALEGYLQWKSGKITTDDFQGELNSLGYHVDILKPDQEKSLINNILSELI